MIREIRKVAAKARQPPLLLAVSARDYHLDPFRRSVWSHAPKRRTNPIDTSIDPDMARIGAPERFLTKLMGTLSALYHVVLVCCFTVITPTRNAIFFIFYFSREVLCVASRCVPFPLRNGLKRIFIWSLKRLKDVKPRPVSSLQPR